MTASATGIGSFADVPLHGEHTGEPVTAAAVEQHVAAAAAAHGYTPDQLDWITPEGIDVKPVYVAADRDAAVAAGYPLDSFPGAVPYIRGPYPTMYVTSPGPSASTPAFPPRPTRMPSTAATWPRDRRGCR